MTQSTPKSPQRGRPMILLSRTRILEFRNTKLNSNTAPFSISLYQTPIATTNVAWFVSIISWWDMWCSWIIFAHLSFGFLKSFWSHCPRCISELDCQLLVRPNAENTCWKFLLRLEVHTGVPQRTKLGSLLFLIMVNLKNSCNMVKYVDNTTVMGSAYNYEERSV